MTRRTKIVATLGPATDEPDVLERLLTAGCDVVRINFSHGDAETHARRIKMVRAAARELDTDVAVLADLAGPKIRIDRFRESSVQLKAGDAFALWARENPPAGDESGVGVAYLGLVDDVEPGSELLLDDGLMALRVERVEGDTIHCTVLTSGKLSDRKGLNLRGGGLSVPGISEADARDIERAAEWQVDYLAVSFPRGAEDMQRARELLEAAGGHAGLVAKIERAEAIENLEAIIEASDAVLVARGDLGVEIGDAELPGLQKRIISASLAANRPVITATQMMQSMVESPIPTRAEVLDVANAVIDGTDAVMLSAETAVGRHPVTVIEAMRRVCKGAERHVEAHVPMGKINVRAERIDQAVAMATMVTVHNLPVKAIIALTESGSTAQWLSRVRSPVPIIALSPNRASLRRMRLFQHVRPLLFVPENSPTPSQARAALERARRAGLVEAGDRVLMTLGDEQGVMGGTNTMKILTVE
ncbi:pyruvate kinase [Wenzhouxiangella sp. XN201]|uniref:pyruvate kinase n=1 Tax=Wenzhouxiangella sp. XN201 TaxID=2710755 RepID=UPI0013CA233E|nr:pyruvate kinase [Wenzhouxiangella sp. XN201]NEZ05012.1 pyruvate kinase [Wenzhouxiangella sp. XN201]